VIKYFKKNNLKYISYYNFIKILFVTLKAKIIIDSGSDFYNFLNLVNKNAIKIHLGHGMGNKIVLPKKKSKSNLPDKYFQKFDYVNFTSNYTIDKVAVSQYKLNKKKIIKFGYPRVEILKKKEIKSKKRIIFYTPTWRPYEYNLPILNLKGFNLVKFKKFLKKNNFLFYYTVHNLDSKKFENIEDKKNIFFIKWKSNPFFDTTNFIKKSNIVINDCSTTSTECSLNNKPQIFIFPDLTKYKKLKGFISSYENNLPGPLVQNYEELEKKIILYIKNSNNYKKKYIHQNQENINKFYDIYSINSNEHLLKFIKEKLLN